MKNVACYKEEPASIDTKNKKVHLIYGLNGTGKTTISDFFYRYQHEEQRFSDCSLENLGDKKILVYNHSFIQDNFYDKDSLKGVFTLSKENKEIKESIEETRAEKSNLEGNKDSKGTDLKNLERSQKENLESAQEKTWEIKKNYSGGDRVLEFCLKKLMGNKEALFHHILNVTPQKDKPTDTIEALKNEAQAIFGEDVKEYNNLNSVELNTSAIENDSIFMKKVTGDEENPLGKLIKELDNSDWVKVGIDYLPEEISSTLQCPFCQKETITNQVKGDLKSYFIGSYEEDIRKIQKRKEQYENEKSSLDTLDSNEYRAHPLMKGRIDRFENYFNPLKTDMEWNLSKIEEKISKPRKPLQLKNIEDHVKKLNGLISEVNEDSKLHNNKIKNKEGEKKEIKNRFWRIMRWDYRDTIDRWSEENKKNKKKISTLKSEIKEITEKISVCNQKMTTLQEKIVNVDEPINNINNSLIGVGIQEFRIERYEDDLYKIVRENQNDNQFTTLSEGEKTIISFLYFMELCKGKEKKNESEKEKVVLIDDPISSLSHVYIFNLAIWIKKHFFNKQYSHVFILTHSLYFFHELIRHIKDKNLFRLTKSTDGTDIQPMQQDEIKNEYESYWQTIKDHNENKATDALLANSMRNILEHFFGFVDKIKLREGLDELNSDFEAFRRFMDRESHSDQINITDYKSINPDNFKKAFKKVFTDLGYKKHYQTMLGEEPHET